MARFTVPSSVVFKWRIDMHGALVGLYQNEFKRYPAFLTGMGVRFDWCLRKPIFLPWGGATPATVFMYDPGGALGLPTTLTAQPGGWNVIAYTTWTTFASACSSLMVSGRGDWALFPGGTTITPDPNSVDFRNAGGTSGKNATYPVVIGTYDASSKTNALDMTLANTKRCKIDYSAITWPAVFLSWSATIPTVIQYYVWTQIEIYAPLQANQVTAFNINGTGQCGLWCDLVSWGGLTGIQYNANLFNYGDEVLVAGKLTSVGTTCTIKDSTGLTNWVNNFNLTGQGTTTFIVSGAAQTAYNGQFTLSMTDAPAAPTSITSSGVTATIVKTGIGTAVAGGKTVWVIQNAVPANYNGTKTLTFVDADTCTYTITTTGGAPATTVGTCYPCSVQYTALSVPSAGTATGTINVTPPFSSMPDKATMLNTAIMRSGFGFCAGFGSTPTGTQGKVQDFIGGSNRNIYQFNVLHHHAGWKDGTVRTPVPKVPSSITSSGTTATINLTGIGTLVSGGQTAWDISGMTPSAFNGKYTLTASGANAATYTFVGAGGASVSSMGSIYAQNGTAQVGLWQGVTPIAVTSASQTGGVATCLTANTSTLAVGGWASVNIPAGSGGTGGKGALQGVFQVTAVVPNVSFSFNCDPRITGSAAGTYGDAESNGWVGAQGDGIAGNGYNHSYYFGDQNENVFMYDCVCSWESSNIKLCGGAITIDGLYELRNPMGFIMASNANVASGNCFPAGSGGSVLNHTQVFSEDVNYITFGFRGWGAFLNKVGLTYRKAVSINQNNPNPSNRNGLQSLPDVTGNPLQIPSSSTVSDCVLDFTANGLSGTGWAITYNRNITSDAAGVITSMNSTGSGNASVAASSTAFQARLTAAKAQTVGTGLRTAMPVFAAVPAGATDQISEDNMMRYMMEHPGDAPWQRILSGFSRAPLGV